MGFFPPSCYLFVFPLVFHSKCVLLGSEENKIVGVGSVFGAGGPKPGRLAQGSLPPGA